MGGEGSMMAANQSLKNNRALLKMRTGKLFRRKIKHFRKSNPNHHEKHLSENEILKLRAVYRKKRIRRNFLVASIMIILAAALILFIAYLLGFNGALSGNYDKIYGR